MGGGGHSTTTSTTTVQKGISVAPSMSGSSSAQVGDLITGDNNKLVLVNLMDMTATTVQPHLLGVNTGNPCHPYFC